MTLKQTNDGKAIYFDRAEMAVRAREVVPGSSSPTGLRDVDTEEDYVATKFANLFTELYDEIAKESPEFERVRELAKAVAIAKWIKKENIPVNMDWVFEYSNKRIETVGKITAISVQWQKQNQELYSEGGLTGIQTTIHKLHLFGGVDLTVNPRYTSDDGNARSLQEAVRSKLRQRAGGPRFTVEHNGKVLQAVVLPITRSGQEMWKNSPSTESNGIVYQLNNQGKVAKITDKSGNTTEYGYDSNGRLKTVRMSNNVGGKTIGERNSNGSLWTVTNPRGNTFKYEYGNSGYLNGIEVDGRKLVTYGLDPRQRELIGRYDGYAERVIYDENGNIREYEIKTEKGGPASIPETEKLTFDYDKSGNIVNIGETGISLVNISYTEDIARPATITTPQAETRYLYYPDGRIKQVIHSSGISATYLYDGDRLAKLQINYNGKQAEYLFNEDGIVQSRDLLGGVADYGYTNGNLSSAKLAQYGEANYVYDVQNRLQEIRFPNGSRIEYQYKEGRAIGKKAGDYQWQRLTVITHPMPETYKEPRTAKRKLSTQPTTKPQFDAIFRQVEENSDKDAAVLMVQKHEGQTYKKFGNRAEMNIISDIEDALAIVFGKNMGNRRTAEEHLRTFLSDVANDGRTVIVWTPGEQFGDNLSLFLTKYMGVRAVFTENIQKARENLTKHQPVGGNTSLVLVDATMLEAQREAIEKEVEQMSFPVGKIARSLQDIPMESNSVVVVAENNPRDKLTFFGQLEAAGKAGKLKDKFIALQYCGESKPEVAKIILDHGATGVFFYERKISVPAVRLILLEADKVMQEKPWMKADEAFRDAIKRAIDIDSRKPEYAPYKHLKRQLEDMLNNFTIVQRPTDVIEKVAFKQLELVKNRAG
jgi:YD repeat-containing protein